MTKHSAAVIERVQTQGSNTGVEDLIREIGLTFWAAPYEDRQDELEHFSGIDEELIYMMGYTVGSLPISASGGTDWYCNGLVGDIAYSAAGVPVNDIQGKASIYTAGYQAGLRAR